MWRCQVERPKSDSGGEGSGTKWSELNLVEIEAEAFLLGHWKNFDELEENLTIEELNAILDAARRKENDARRFAAALKGVDYDKATGGEEYDPVEKAKRQAQEILTGKSMEQLDFEEIGIGVESFEEE